MRKRKAKMALGIKDVSLLDLSKSFESNAAFPGRCNG